MAASAKILPQRASHRFWIDAEMLGETPVLQSERRSHDAIGRAFERPVAVVRLGRVLGEGHLRDEGAVAIGDDEGWFRGGEMGARQGGEGEATKRD